MQYVGSFSSCSSESLESSDANATTKRRKICTEEIDEECVNSAENKTASNNCGEDGGNFMNNMAFLFGFSIRSFLPMVSTFF